MTLYPLYIDPGTGSALFSIIIGIAAAAYFLARGIFIKLKVLFSGKANVNKSNQKYVIYAEEKRYWDFFEPILDEIENRKIEVAYLTSSEDDPIFTSNYKYIKGVNIGSGNKAFAYLNFLSASFVLTTTPELDVLQWKRSKNVKHYSHFIHMAGGTSLYRLFALDYFDSILLPSDTDIPEIRFLENKRNLKPKELIVAGNPFFDNYINKINTLPKEQNHEFTVLVAPSWGPQALLTSFGEKLLDPLSNTGWRIIIRPHPQSFISEKDIIDKLKEKYKNNTNFEWDTNRENIYSLSKADIMISDFSGVIFDYIFLFERPVLTNIHDMDLRRYDAYDLETEPFYINAVKNIGFELNENSLGSIKEIIENLSNDSEYRQKITKIKNEMWQYPGESAKRIVDFMVETVEKENAI